MRREGPPHGQSLYVAFIVVAVVLAVSLALFSAIAPGDDSTAGANPSGGADPVRPTGVDVGLQTPSASAQLALADFLEAEFGRGRYAGPCENAESPRDLLKRCTRLVADAGERRAYIEGATFSEFVRWLFVERLPSGRWRVYGVAPFDFFGDTNTIPWPRP